MRGSYSPGGKPYLIPIGSCMPYGCWFIVKYPMCGPGAIVEPMGVPGCSWGWGWYWCGW